jgi:putative chitinase
MTPAQLATATGARIDRANEWLSVIASAMLEFDIDTRLRQAMFLAQIGHESGGMHYTTEIWGNTAAQLRYEGRKDLGNTVEGDGFKYRGRGLIQTTGRYNYEKTASALGIDCVNNPDLLAEPVNAARSAAWWWQSHNLNRFADAGDIIGCTKVINGGTNGIDQRTKLYQAALKSIPEIVVETVVETIQESPTKAPRPLMVAIMALFKFIASFAKKP